MLDEITCGLNLDLTLEYRPERVVSIVCPSRSGSTIIKWALSRHPDVCSLAGEEEPYYKLTRNGYPWDESDEFHSLRNYGSVRLMIANELHNNDSTENRRWLQLTQIEEPPFVEPQSCRLRPTLILKTPQNVYRRGVIEGLYPEAEVIYFGVTRRMEAIVNGLMDGWLSDDFKARLTPQGWWKFDMPPNWDWNSELLTRCVGQWQAAVDFLERDYSDRLITIEFEKFESNPIEVCREIWAILGLSRYDLCDDLPVLSATDSPSPERWKKKRPWLTEQIAKMMEIQLW